MSDIPALIDRLRACGNGIGSFKTDRGDFGLCDEAADSLSRLAKELEEAVRQIEYLHGKFGETGSGNTVIARARSAIRGLSRKEEG